LQGGHLIDAKNRISAVALLPFRRAYSLVGLPEPSRNPSFPKSGQISVVGALEAKALRQILDPEGVGSFGFCNLGEQCCDPPVCRRVWQVMRSSPS